MLRYLTSAAFLVASLTVPLAARPVTVDALMELRDVSDVRLSPDGSEILYVVSHPDFDVDAWQAVLWRVPAAGGEPQRLTWRIPLWNVPRPSSQVRWSPDGSRISFLASVDGAPQVMVMGADGGEPHPITSIAGGARTYVWHPDSQRIAFLAPQPASEEEEKLREEKRWVELVDRHPKPGRIWVQDEPGGEARPVTPLGHFVSGFDVSPDGKWIAYGAAAQPGYMNTWRTRLYVVPWRGGEPRALVDRGGMNDSPRFSPDGATVAFLTTSPGESILSNLRLATVPSSGGEVDELHRDADHWVGEFLWAPDGESIFYLTNQNAGGEGAAMFEQQVFELSVPQGEVRKRTAGRRFVSSLTLSRDGTRAAYEASHASSMGDVFVASTGDWIETRLTDLHPQMRELDWGSLEPLSWRSFDGMEIWGLLMLPPRHRPGTRIPLVVYCHGGPVGGFSYAVYPQFPHIVGQASPYPSQAMASAGMGVLFPMPRGGSGYGEAGFRMIVGAWGEPDYRDIMAGVDHLIEQGVADPDRLGVMGASYGGFMTSWIVTQTDRFAAASTGASVNDLADLWALSDAGDFLLDYFGKPWENAQTYRRHSPLTHAAEISTPLLIQHGELDMRVPVAQARELYRVLEAMGKTVELEIYPRGGHVLFEPDLQREQQQRNLDWFVRWLRPAGAARDASAAASP